MGWMGMAEHVMYALGVAGADRQEDGRFLVYGEAPVSFMGMGEELVVSDNIEYSVKGRRYSLAGLMNSKSYGVRNIRVI